MAQPKVKLADDAVVLWLTSRWLSCAAPIVPKRTTRRHYKRKMGNGMDKIVNGIYVGSIRDSKDQIQFKENNITHVLSIHDNATKVRSATNPLVATLICCQGEDRGCRIACYKRNRYIAKYKLKDIQYLCIAARDCSSQDLSQYFSETNDFIHKARLKDGNVLIHCLAGVSRSVTVTVAYLMTVTSLGWRDALNAVRGARRAANPNFGFQRQLLAFEHEKLIEERQRLVEAFGPSPFNDTERCRDLLELHREWVLHGDTPSKDEDRDTYPLPHKAYGQRDALRQEDSVKKEQKSPRSMRHTSYQDPTQVAAKDQKTVTLESYLNVKAGKEAKLHFRQQEERELTNELKARCRSNQAGAASAVASADPPLEGATGGAAAAASATGSAATDNTSNKVDELFNSS